MKQLIVGNLNEKNSRYRIEPLTILLNSQIENSIELGWNSSDIILLTNFKYEFMGVKATIAPLNNFCYTGSKMFALKWWTDNNNVDYTIWSKDLDCWQNVKFNEPEFLDVGISCYSNNKYNGGSIFWKPESKDIIDLVVKTLTDDKEIREEPMLNKILKSHKYKDRVSVLNNTYNVGCSGFVKRYKRSIKPIRVCHFHPYNRLAWETHALDRNKIGSVAITIRLERLLRKYYKNLASIK